MPKSLYEIHLSFLAPEEGVVTTAATSEEEARQIVLSTLDQVRELNIISIKNLGAVPDETEMNSAEETSPVDPKQIN